MKSETLLLVTALLGAVCGEVFFEEKFTDASWEERWTYSKNKDKTFGKFKLTAGKFYNDANEDQGLQTEEDARFYGLSTKFEPFSNEGKDLVIQFSVKHEQNIDCGGGYLKVFDCSLNPEELHGESPYQIMFGPDICGPGQKKVHVIFSYNGKNHLIKKDIRCKDDVFTHFYTLIVKPDNTYKVLIDNKEVEQGTLEEDWDFLPPKQIADESQKKPADWVDHPTMPDPDDTKPEDWDKPEHIQDPDAVKPEDWDDEMDGEWEPPLVDNPEYKGEWKPKQIDNPAYKGEWVQPMIDNPEYKADANIYLRSEICAVGLDLWQVKSGTIFDNFLITDDATYASTAAETATATQEGEKKMKDVQDEAERKAAETEEKKDDDSAKDDEDDDDEEPENEEKTENHDEL